MKSPLLAFWNWFKDAGAYVTGAINWETSKVATPEEIATIKSMLKDNYYVIATRHNGHGSSYVIAFAHWVFTRKWGYYAHVLMNLEDEIKTDDDYRFIEAVGTGVRIAGFDNAIDNQTSSIALLKPKAMTLEKWTAALDKAKQQEGKPYDTVFDLANDQALSCVEVVRVALQSDPNYAEDFAEFEKMIAKYKNLTPQMYYDCPDFEVVWETRH